MKLLRAVAIFCEDLRQEGTGQDILIGTMSDNLGLPGFPAMLPKLAVYLRAYFDTSSKPEAISAWVQFPWGQRIDLGEAAADLVRGAIDEAKSNNAPLAGVIFKGLISPFAVPSPGIATAHIRVGKHEHLCGMLNLTINPNLNANASPPQP
jgi:hypothetical protein